jgi:hypothetical protein
MGLSTPENRKQLKQLMKDRKKKAYELKRLQSKQKASNKYRVKRRKIVKKTKNFLNYFYFIFVSLRLNIYLKLNLNYIHN